MLILGIDPSPSVHTGWALVDFTTPSAPLWYNGGTAHDVAELFDMLEEVLDLHPSHVAIEEPKTLFNPLANVQVMATSWAGGRVEGLAESRGFDVIKVGQNQWRQALVGHSLRGENVSHKVLAELRRIVRQLPERTSEHARDACGVAIVGHRILLGRIRPIGRVRP